MQKLKYLEEGRGGEWNIGHQNIWDRYSLRLFCKSSGGGCNVHVPFSRIYRVFDSSKYLSTVVFENMNSTFKDDVEPLLSWTSSSYRKVVQVKVTFHYSLKKLSFCHKLWYSKPFLTRCRRSLIFKTTKAVILNNLSLNIKYVLHQIVKI